MGGEDGGQDGPERRVVGRVVRVAPQPGQPRPLAERVPVRGGQPEQDQPLDPRPVRPLRIGPDRPDPGLDRVDDLPGRIGPNRAPPVTFVLLPAATLGGKPFAFAVVVVSQGISSFTGPLTNVAPITLVQKA